MRLLLSLVPLAACLSWATGADTTTTDTTAEVGPLVRATATSPAPGCPATAPGQSLGMARVVISGDPKAKDVCASAAPAPRETCTTALAEPFCAEKPSKVVERDAARQTQTLDETAETQGEAAAPVVKDVKPMPAKDKNEF